MTSPSEPELPRDPAGSAPGPAGDVPAEIVAIASTADPDPVLHASIQRRQRLVDEIDLARDAQRATEVRLRRTQAALQRATGSVGYRFERSIRDLLRPIVRRGRPAGDPGDVVPPASGAAPAAGVAPPASAAAAPDPTAQFRTSMTDRLTRTFALGRDPIRVVLIGHASPTSDDCAADRVEQVRNALLAVGLDVTVVDGPRPPDASIGAADAVLVLCPSAELRAIPRRSISTAWLGDRPGPWLDRADLDDIDIVLVADEATRADVEGRTAKAAWIALDPGVPTGAQPYVEALLRWVTARRVAIHIGAPTWDVAAGWGDAPFARDVQKAFERRGWPTTVHVTADQDGEPALRADLAVHIAGVRAAEVRPWQTSVLWIISHPDLVRREICRRYDLVAVASDGFLDLLRGTLGDDAPPLLALHQATDPDRFFPEAGGPAHGLLFVGSARKVERTITAALVGTPHDLAVYGRNWTPDRVDPRHLRGTWIPNEVLRRYYGAASIVLSDTLADMRDEGFIPNRVYDALASGGFVISETVAGMAEEFDGAVVEFRDREDLLGRIDHYLAHPEERAALAEIGRRAVLARHTFGHRVDAMLTAVTPLVERHG